MIADFYPQADIKAIAEEVDEIVLSIVESLNEVMLWEKEEENDDSEKCRKWFFSHLIVFIASFSVAMGGEKADAKNQGKTTIEPLKTYEDCIELSPTKY